MFFFDIRALLFKPTLNALKNLIATVAFIGLQTNSSMPTHPDQHTPNGAGVSYSTLVVFFFACFQHKRLVTPLKSLSTVQI